MRVFRHQSLHHAFNQGTDSGYVDHLLECPQNLQNWVVLLVVCLRTSSPVCISRSNNEPSWPSPMCAPDQRCGWRVSSTWWTPSDPTGCSTASAAATVDASKSRYWRLHIIECYDAPVFAAYRLSYDNFQGGRKKGLTKGYAETYDA